MDEETPIPEPQGLPLIGNQVRNGVHDGLFTSDDAR
ncbi:hypothetical protein HYQ46_013358 [Verticillium longisporum]|nr:hypothetical protein HYQ46_013358 [Verticillium longisporum]